MFIQFLIPLIFSSVTIQSIVTNSSKGQKNDVLTLPKQTLLYDDYDLNEQKLENNGDGSGGSASFDEYADDDDDDDEQLVKITATTTKMSTTNRTTIIITTKITNSTTITTLPSTITTTTTTTTTQSNQWSKSSLNDKILQIKHWNTTTISSAFNDIDGSEFKDDNDEYADDLEDDAYYNEAIISDKQSSTIILTTLRYPIVTTRQSISVNYTTPIWMLFTFLTRPPIAIGILAGLAIGILTSFILLICIIQRYNKREQSHSSYTTGLLYPNQYGYSKSPQEFYA